ncbi:MAG: nicotinic acid mononucleotide adenylyltransferase [Bacteroidetes bacterium CG_4_10_14_3_um_filter_31_20]|nr:MAG: nicotinic acid mononucleotide adenylyltransferase [Bacteroidetes bacterium CG_4_8_14_3_um_filter_31_14]PIY02724.1 MAG: nicotinic acid mononucleotide adenylyltransferase [Bacteroidetes bacterium CG_4_10_14_3_um_filter_31_20]
MGENKLTGLFFGSFNPVHVGHLVIANYMLEYTEIKELWFIVSPQNPFKEKKLLAPEYHRLEMVRLAIGENNKMKASDIEFKMPKPSYTIDTLAYLKDKFPKRDFALIMGADNLKSFEKWKNFEQILNNSPLLVYPRIGFTNSNIELKGDIRNTEAPVIEISSTFIREGIKMGKDLRFYLNDKVYEYITDCGLYK